MSDTYRVNEVFYSLQGEGMRAGTANVFVRFTGCNLQCDIEPGPKSPGGFACDTEFASGRAVTLNELHKWIVDSQVDAAGVKVLASTATWVILTGGEPALQVDDQLIRFLHGMGYKIAIETNGSIALPDGLDWITVSPKVAEHAIRQIYASEVKYVRGYGQDIPRTACKAEHYLISPATNGITFDRRTVQWCIDLCLKNPLWRLSPQMHKVWAVR